MSVTITRTPKHFQPGLSDDLYFILSGDSVNEPKFRYVYNVIVNGYNVFEGKATPNQYGKGIVDIQRILDTYLQNYPIATHNTTDIFTHQTSPFSVPYDQNVVEYYIEVGEEYADTLNGNITGFTGTGSVGSPSVQSSTFKSFLGTMGVNRKSNLPSFDIGQFTLSGSPTPDFPYTENCLFLTNSPRIMDITENEYYTLSFTNYELGGNYLSEPYFVEYTFFDSDNNLITAHTYANIIENGGGPAINCEDDYYDTFTSTTRNYNILNVGVGPKNIYNFPSETAYYQVQLYGKAIPPTPSPTPTSTPTPTPSLTPNSSPTPTPTPSSTPEECYQYQFINRNLLETESFIYVDCDGLTVEYELAGGEVLTVCLRFYYPNPDILALNLGTCPTPPISPTPTPSLYSTPTPSAINPVAAIVRSCCDGVTELQIYVDSTLSVGDAIMIDEECYEIYSFGGEAWDGDYSTAPAYNNCAECKAQYPCDVTEDKPSTERPNVEPDTFTPTGGTSPCQFGLTPVSEVFQFNVKECENYFENAQIMFKNRYGQWDYFLFEKYRSEGLGIERETYGKYNTTWGTNDPKKTTYSRGKTDFNTKMNETHILNSGFLNDPEFVWLEELYTSNDVYLIEPDGTLFAVNIEDTEFVRKSKGNRSITNIQLTISYSNNIKLLNN